MHAPRRRLVILLALSLIGASGACTGDDGGAAAPAPSIGERVRRHSDRSGALSVGLPDDLLVHRFDGALAATTTDGRFRLHLERVDPELPSPSAPPAGGAIAPGEDEASDRELMRLAGAAKDALDALGWVVVGEQHRERAIRVRLERGLQPRERREIWWIRSGGRIAICDGLVRGSADSRLGEALETLCRGLQVDS